MSPIWLLSTWDVAGPKVTCGLSAEYTLGFKDRVAKVKNNKLMYFFGYGLHVEMTFWIYWVKENIKIIYYYI